MEVVGEDSDRNRSVVLLCLLDVKEGDEAGVQDDNQEECYDSE